MAAELKCVNGTRNSVRNVPTGKSGLPFRFSTFSGNFPVGRADETFSTYCRTEISGNFDEMQSALDLRRSFPDRPSDPNFALSPGFSHKAKIKMVATCLISGRFPGCILPRVIWSERKHLVSQGKTSFQYIKDTFSCEKCSHFTTQTSIFRTSCAATDCRSIQGKVSIGHCSPRSKSFKYLCYEISFLPWNKDLPPTWREFTSWSITWLELRSACSKQCRKSSISFWLQRNRADKPICLWSFYTPCKLRKLS